MTKILLLTNSEDGENSEAVADHIVAKGHEVIRFDADRFSAGECSLHWHYSGVSNCPILETKDSQTNLSEVDSVWFRRPYSLRFDIEDQVQRGVAEEEVRDVIDGLFATLQGKFWVSPVANINQARLKPFQLAAAGEMGLRVPETVITNSPSEARNFCREPAVFKPIAGYHFDYPEETATAFTTLLSEEHLAQLELVRAQPVMLQRWITKAYEIRATYVDGKFLTARLDVEDFSNIPDWRLPEHAGKVAYSEFKLPEYIEELTRRFLQRLGLLYAAVDFAVDADGNHYFLEVNPVGQWLWIEDLTGLKISEAIADALVMRGGER